jgi:hypothetical protein
MRSYVNTTIFVLACVVTAALTHAQTPVRVQVSDPRPLKTAIDQIESTLGIPISYEDPRFEFAGDTQDVTDQVQSARQRAANPTVRIIVPRGGILTLESSILSKPAQISDVLALVTQLRIGSEANNFPGRFVIKQVGSTPIVEPTAVRGQDGSWKPVGPAMETHITFPSQQRNAAETLKLIAADASQALKIKIGVGRFPVLAFANTSVTVGADDEPANLVLGRLFTQLAVNNSGTAQAAPAYSYRLLYDPGVKYYLLHINAIAATDDAKPSSAPIPGPVSPPAGTRLGVKKGK